MGTECNISNYLVNFRCSLPALSCVTWCFIREQPSVDLCGSCGSDDDNSDGDGIVNDDNERIIDEFCIRALLH